jgi:hypothetical protein
MLHLICATLVVAALLAEATVIRHWTQQHALVQQAAAAGEGLQIDIKVGN